MPPPVLLREPYDRLTIHQQTLTQTQAATIDEQTLGEAREGCAALAGSRQMDKEQDVLMMETFWSWLQYQTKYQTKHMISICSSSFSASYHPKPGVQLF